MDVGDVIDIEISGIGTLTNAVVGEAENVNRNRVADADNERTMP